MVLLGGPARSQHKGLTDSSCDVPYLLLPPLQIGRACDKQLLVYPRLSAIRTMQHGAEENSPGSDLLARLRRFTTLQQTTDFDVLP